MWGRDEGPSRRPHGCGRKVPNYRAETAVTLNGVNMYVDVLSAAMDAWNVELTGDALLDYVIACRAQLLLTGVGQGRPANDSLAAEVTYDRALIRLCDDVGVVTSVANFADPRSERNRLEDTLSGRAGIDLPSLSRARATDGRI